jgi:hypothetical protein
VRSGYFVRVFPSLKDRLWPVKWGRDRAVIFGMWFFLDGLKRGL